MFVAVASTIVEEVVVAVLVVAVEPEHEQCLASVFAHFSADIELQFPHTAAASVWKQ